MGYKVVSDSALCLFMNALTTLSKRFLLGYL